MRRGDIRNLELVARGCFLYCKNSNPQDLDDESERKVMVRYAGELKG